MTDPSPHLGRVPSPIGTFEVVFDGRTVQVVDLAEPGVAQTGAPVGARIQKPPFPPGSPPRQLQEYFQGERDRFDLEIAPPTGTDFDRRVWNELFKIPPGTTMTYGELARRAGFPGAARAVGGAVGRNPIPILVPCHRVVGADETLTGFGLGLWRKKWLLMHEGSWPLKSRSAEGPRPGGQRRLDEDEPPRRGRAGRRPGGDRRTRPPSRRSGQPA